MCPELNDKEEDLLEKLAMALDAKILKIPGKPDKLFNLLENYKLSLISCHIQEDNPWNQKVAFTTPYLINSEKYVWAVPQGENAWLKYLDEFIYSNEGN